MPFTEPEAKEPTTPVTLRVPRSILAYLKVAGAEKAPGSEDERGQTDVILKAVLFDKEIGEKTAKMRDRIRAFAESQGLTLRDEPAEVLFRLIKRGLEASESEKSGTKGSK